MYYLIKIQVEKTQPDLINVIKHVSQHSKAMHFLERKSVSPI